ncbi:hypothetical protein [Komagataeibacter medellinensis]|uniref:Uncharacterized protein n=1 Tax=Komagataeibacter medellinensis (strain NBRC 3288 / BCRC 11682 / LMG 1693 / Kondo 51) TaxID=634177 RepID=G2I0W6_KOMMN|nr:hypothetical protein [Komagataeibacter medellinensis]BAK84574.1 hypothetical protein GLX_21620 [Komagataeibacter medellinensis NBRC 3288]
MIHPHDEKWITWATRNMPSTAELLRAVLVVSLIWLALIVLWMVVVP